MNTILNKFKSSASELKSVNVLTICAILLALRVILGMFEITIGTYRISLSFLPIAISGLMFGPVVGAIMAVLGDIITLIVHPTGFPNFGIMFSQALGGAIYGLFLYKQFKISIIRTILTCLSVTVFCNLIITSISLNIAYGTPYEVMMPLRLLSNSLLLPIHIVLLYSAQLILARIKLPMLKGRIVKNN